MSQLGAMFAPGASWANLFTRSNLDDFTTLGAPHQHCLHLPPEATRPAVGAARSSLSAAVLLGLLGCGSTARRYLVPAIARLPNARLTAAYDVLPEPRQAVARAAPGCRAFDSMDAMLQARVLDAVVVGGPPESRAGLAVSALAAGLPVLLEHPMAASLDEADWIGEAERAVRIPIMVGLYRWWWAPAERLRRALAGVPEGEPEVESVVAIEAGEADPAATLAAHIELVRHILDREIATLSGRQESPGEIQATVTFQGGGTARCRTLAAERPEERVGVRWGARRYELRLGSRCIWPAGGPVRRAIDLLDSALRRGRGARDPVHLAYEAMLRAFVHGVQTRTYAGPGGAAGSAALLAMAALRRSLDEGGTEMMVPATSPHRPVVG